MTSRTEGLLPGEFAMKCWKAAGLNVPTAVKRGVYAVAKRLIMKRIGRFAEEDESQLNRSMKSWLDLA